MLGSLGSLRRRVDDFCLGFELAGCWASSFLRTSEVLCLFVLEDPELRAWVGHQGFGLLGCACALLWDTRRHFVGLAFYLELSAWVGHQGFGLLGCACALQ